MSTSSPQECPAAKSDGEVSLDDWFRAATDTMAEVAEGPLDCEMSLLDRKEGHSTPSLCASIPLVSSTDSIQIGLVASSEVCDALTRILMCMDEDEELEGDSDVADAMGEIVNIVAGAMKSHLEGRVEGLELGLPLVARDVIDNVPPTRRTSAAIRLGSHEATLFVWKKPRSRRLKSGVDAAN